MDGYGVSKEEIELIIKRGMKWKEEERDIWYATMANYTVVFAKGGDAIIVVTVYPAGREK